MPKGERLNILEEKISSFFKKCDVNLNYKIIAALKQKQPCISQVLYTAMEESRLGLEKLQKVFFMICDEAKKNKEFARWIAPSLKQTYVKIRAAKTCNIQKEEILKKLLLCQELDYYEWDEPKEYLEAIGKILKVKEFSDPDKLKNLEEKFQDQQWRRLRDLCGEIHEQERKKCLRVSKRNAIKKRTDLAKQSELDRTIFQHLLKSFEAEHLSQNSYTNNDFQSFKGEMEKLTGKLGFKKEHIDIEGEVNLEQDEQAQILSQQPSFFYNKILALKNQLYPIYIPRLVELLEQDSEALNFLASKRVIAFLGSSGAGKSTFAQMALGYRFREMKDKRLAIEPISEQHRSFVDPSNKGVKYCEGKQYQNSYLVDMPAFYNLDDKTAEIASILKIKRLLYYSEFSLPVFVFNFREWGSDDHVFKNFCRKVSIFFEKGTPQVLYAFSNMRKQETETLIRKIKNFKLSEAEKGDTMFMKVVNQLKDLVNQIIHDQKYKKQTLEQLIKDCPRLIIISNPCTFYMNEIIYKLNNPRKKSDPKKISITLPLGESEAVREATEQFEALARSYIKMDQTQAALFYANCLRDLADKTKKLNDVACAEKRLDSLKKGLEEEHEELLGKFTDCLKVEPSLQSLAEAKQYEDRLLQLDSKCKQLWFMKDLRTKQKTRNAANGLIEKILGIGREEGELERTVKLAELFEKHFGEDKKLRQQIENLRCRKRDELERGQSDIKELSQIENTCQKLKAILNYKKQQRQLLLNLKKLILGKTRQKKFEIEHCLDNKKGLLKIQQIQLMKKIIGFFCQNEVIEGYKEQNLSNFFHSILNLIKTYFNKSILDLDQFFTLLLEEGSADFNIQKQAKQSKQNCQLLTKEIKELGEPYTGFLNLEIKKLRSLTVKSRVRIQKQIMRFSQGQWRSIQQIYHQVSTIYQVIDVLSNVSNGFEQKQLLKMVENLEQDFFSRLEFYMNSKKQSDDLIELSPKFINSLKIYSAFISLQEQKEVPSLSDDSAAQINLSEVSSTSSKQKVSQQHENCYCQQGELYPQIKELTYIAPLRQEKEQEGKVKSKIRRQMEKLGDQIKQKIVRIKQKTQKKIAQSLSNDQKQHTLLLLISNLEKLKNFSQIIVTLQLTTFYQRHAVSIILDLKNQIESLNQKLIVKLEQLKELKNENERFLQSNHIIDFNKKRIMFQKLMKIKIVEEIFLQQEEENNYNIKKLKLFMHSTLENLYQRVSLAFSSLKTKTKKYSQRGQEFQIFLSNLSPFQLIDQVIDQQYDYDFRSLISSFKAHIADAIKIQNLSCEPSTFIKNNQIDTYQFRRVHSFLSKFGPETKEALQKQLVMDAISGQLKRDEDDLQRLLLRRLHKQRDFQPDGLVDQICLKAESLLRTVTQVQDVVKETEEGEMSSHFISDATMEKISNKVIQIVDSLEAEIRSSISEGGEGQKRAEQYIKLLAHVQRVFNQLKVGGLQEHVKEKLEDTSYGRELHQYLAEKLSYQKKDRYQRYIQSDQIIFDDNLWKELEKIKEPQRNRVVLKIAYQIEEQLEEILTREEDWDRTELRREIDGYKREMKTKKLPIELKLKTEAIFERFQKKLVEQQQKEKKYIQENFKIEEAIERIGTEKNPKRLEVYKRQAGKYFEKQLNKLFQSQNISQLLVGLQNLFLMNSQDLELVKNSQLNKIYEKYLKSSQKEVCDRIEKIKIRVIEKQLFSYHIGQFHLTILDQVKVIMKQIVLYWQYLKKDKDQDLNVKKHFEMLQGILLIYFEKNLLQMTHNLTRERIKSYPSQLFNWSQYKQIFKAVYQHLQTDNDKFICVFDKEKEIISWKKLTIERIQKFTFFTESMRNNSQKEKEQVFQKLQEDVLLLEGFHQSKYFSQALGETIIYEKKRLQDEIQEGIRKSCDQLDRGFEQAENQFSKDVNLTMIILQIGLKKLSFLSLDQKKKKDINIKIESKYSILLDELKTNIRQIKSSMLEKKERIQTLKKKEIILKLTIQNKQKEFDKEIQKMTQRLQNQIRLQPAQENNLRKNHKREADQKRRQLSSYIQQLKQNLTKEYDNLNKFPQSLLNKFHFNLIIFQKACLQISFKQADYLKQFDKTLKVIKESLGKQNLNRIYESLQKMNSNYTNILINQHQVFKHNQAQKWTAKVRGQGIDYVLSNLNISHDEKKGLKEMFVSYTEEFEKWTKAYSQNPNSGTIQKLISSAKKKAKNLTEMYDGSSGREGKHPEKLLADIYALWTITKSDIEEQMVDFYYQPHPAQVVSVFLCLSFLESHQTEKLQSKMAQIGTGQGKSVVLAGLSSYLAMCGFEVDSVCYSGYLSGRDGDAFKSLFQKLGVDKKINYGTFENLCQSLLNRKTGEYNGLRQQVKAALEEDNPENSERICQKIASFFKSFESKNTEDNKKINKQIMLIDQVDVFFDPSFFGSVYRPDIQLQSPQITYLLKFIWQKYKEKTKLSEDLLSKSTQFKKIIKKYNSLQQLFNFQLRGMILGCYSSNSPDHQYFAQDDLIKYKDKDSISSKISYGFKTVFAYLKQSDKKIISDKSLQNALKISLIIAEFSYAMLPNYFKSIIGVTGTYHDMHETKKSFIQKNYKVSNYYVIPSVYGTEKRLHINQTQITPKQSIANTIINEIKQIVKTQRPVLVFFRSSLELDNLFNNPLYESLQQRTTYLNQTHDPATRDLRIKKTCNKGRITFMTSSFGRGTDFVAYDESIYKIGKGGLHVIQTFLSAENSEQIQIKGRTARQGNPGTYSLIIQDKQLQVLNLAMDSIPKFQFQVRQARRKLEQGRWRTTCKLLEQAQKKHRTTISVYQKCKQLKKYLSNLNYFPSTIQNVKPCKILIMFDVTGSMSVVIQKLLELLSTFVDYLIKIPKQHQGVKPFQIQLFAYRNYDQPVQTLFQHTNFQTSSHNLLSFLLKMQAYGGLLLEAGEIGFYHINKNPDIDLVILIADSPANTPNDTIQKRQIYKGQGYWISKGIPLLSRQVQLQKIIHKKIPINCFFINTQPQFFTEKYYSQVSSKTGGVCQKFDVYASDSSKKLTNFIGSNVLPKLAKDEKQAKVLLEQFKKRYSL